MGEREREREREMERRDEAADWRGWIPLEDEMAGKGRTDIVSGCESFITERELSRAERGELGIFDVVAGRYEYRKVSKGIPQGREADGGCDGIGKEAEEPRKPAAGRDDAAHAAAPGTQPATLRNC